MSTKAPSDAARAYSTRLARLLDALPSYLDDKPAYIAAIACIKLAIAEQGGAVRDDWNGARVRLHGISATSTTGVAGACRNWITQVTLKAAAAAMSSVDHGPGSVT